MKTYEEFINCIMKNNMARNPNWWWSMNYNMHDPQFQEALNNSTLLSSPTSLFSSQYVAGSSSLALNPYADNQDLPESWSQLLLDGLARDDDKLYLDHFQSKKLENYWEDQMLHRSPRDPFVDHVKQEISEISSNNILNGHGDEDFNTCTQSANWPQTMPVSSPRSSCVTSLSNNILDFSHNKLADGKNQQPDHSSECNSTATGGVCKKARAQSSSSQTHLMVRKEKRGDRITALHQLVSPFGKTDTASVLLEAIGYIRFLQGQIEVLSSPYLSGNMRNQHSVQGEKNCIFPEDPGQLLNDKCHKSTGPPDQLGTKDALKDLRSRGLCLVPVSYTQQVGSDNNGADYWAPAFGGGF